MKIGKACAIFGQIEKHEYTEQDKLQAIKEVIAMPTHNGITKDEILNAFRWFFGWAVEQTNAKPTNADRIRAMSDEELAALFCKVKADYQWAEPEYPSEDACEEWEEWLQSEVEE